ncbi:MAG TPA: hypothetical protein VKE70_03375, partial [Candidatus Solibacter sp.]|nr:hypothetical protein [Candidatus Solibacter sp.]
SEQGFFEGKHPSWIILLAFPAVTLPVAAGVLLAADQRILLGYLWLFGLTHFVLTLSVYLQRENLRHFTTTPANILLYIVIPLAILMGFYAVGVLQLRARIPALAIGLSCVVRLLDFNHLNRQTFGVYQLFKARMGLRPQPAMKRAEQGFYLALTGVLFVTFLAGGASPFLSPPGAPLLPIAWLRVAAMMAMIVAAGFGATCITMLVCAWRDAGRPAGVSGSLAYFAFQTASAVLSIVSLPLYLATLAIHYVEYHVLMFPRCFHARLEESSRLDRCFAWLRRSPVSFYGTTILLAGIVMMFTNLRGPLPAHPLRYLAVVSVFDGLFVFHYFVETLIWRFSDPFYRKTLGALYFRPKARAR